MIINNVSSEFSKEFQKQIEDIFYNKIVKFNCPKNCKDSLKVVFNMKDGRTLTEKVKDASDARIYLGGDVYPVLEDDVFAANAQTEEEILDASRWNSIEVVLDK